MSSIEHVLAAVDFSDYSLPVLYQAIDLCQAFDADMILVNVINQRDVDAIRYVEPLHLENVSVQDYIHRHTQERTTRMSRLLDQVAWDESRTKILIKVGVPFEQLIQAARETKAQMVVMGPKGRTNLSSVFFGTTAEKMFRHCPVSLLSVRGLDTAGRTRSTGTKHSASLQGEHA